MNSIENRIKIKVKKIEEKRPSSKILFPDDVKEKLEKWRRGDL
jgi:predicted RNA-binding protein with PIN domain